MKLQPGIYNIKGRYLALDGFSERKFEIKPQTKVMIKSDTKTKVYYKIEKKWDGTPLHNKMIFNVTYEPFSPKTTAVEKIVEEKLAPPQVVQQFPRRFRENQFPRRRRIQEPPPRETSRNMIVLQIKTVPSGADVIIDGFDVMGVMTVVTGGVRPRLVRDAGTGVNGAHVAFDLFDHSPQ